MNKKILIQIIINYDREEVINIIIKKKKTLKRNPRADGKWDNLTGVGGGLHKAEIQTLLERQGCSPQDVEKCIGLPSPELAHSHQTSREHFHAGGLMLVGRHTDLISVRSLLTSRVAQSLGCKMSTPGAKGRPRLARGHTGGTGHPLPGRVAQDLGGTVSNLERPQQSGPQARLGLCTQGATARSGPCLE